MPIHSLDHTLGKKFQLLWKDAVRAIWEDVPMDSMLRRQASLINLSLSTFNYLKFRQQVDSSCMSQIVAGSVMTTLPDGDYKKRCLLTIMVSQIL
jgi:hypothetical protein